MLERWHPMAVLACLLLISTWACSAQQRGPAGVVKQHRQTEAESRWALLIGVGAYEGKPGINDLRFTIADARALKRTLVDRAGVPSDHVLLMTDGVGNPNHRPTRSNIIAGMTSWLGLAQENDTVLVFFAGHGIEADGTSYLLPSDAKMANLRLTSIRLSYFMEELRACHAKRKLLVLDACHSGAGRNAARMGQAFEREIDQSRGLVVLASCRLGEQSYEWDAKGRGVFSYFLTEGLSGAADRDEDGDVTAGELNRYVWHHTRHWAAQMQLKQTPRYQATEVEGDIVVARLTSAPPNRSDSVTGSEELQEPRPARRPLTAVVWVVLALVLLAGGGWVWARKRKVTAHLDRPASATTAPRPKPARPGPAPASPPPVQTPSDPLARLLGMTPEEQPFKVRVWVEAAEAVPTRDIAVVSAHSTSSHRVGDKIRVCFAAAKACYLTLVNVGPTGNVTVLFPNRFVQGNRVEPGRIYHIPGPGYPFEYVLSPPAGRERVKAIATSQPLSLPELDAPLGDAPFHAYSAQTPTRDIVIEKMGNHVTSLAPDQWAEDTCEFSVSE